MNRTSTVKVASTVAGCTAALFLGLVATASPAGADPVDPLPPPAPAPSVQAAATDAAPPEAAPPEGVPHLLSLDNLPPGTSDVPTEPAQGRGVEYLRDLWHAVQTQEVSGSQALLLLTQRPMNAEAAPPPGLPAGPQPLTPAGPPAPAIPAAPLVLPDAPGPPAP
ncbi:MAG TPA: hypothetical protein VGO30_26325 [Mycobacterium sp.]|nr:hypothetical protein [Mycobacterium sp.]